MVAAEQVGKGMAGWAPGAGASTHGLSPPQYGKKKLKYLPYNHQHEYFFLSEYGEP